MIRKTFEEWERARGMYARDLTKYKTSKDLSEEEFIEITSANLADFAGVDTEHRLKFLKENGYEVNRANLIDPELSAKPREE